MHRDTNPAFLPTALLLLALPSTALAEGFDELMGQPVAADTVLYVDIFDSARESILFEGYGSIQVWDPDGYQLGTSYSSGEEIDLEPNKPGAYKIELAYQQDNEWDISVLNPTEPGGRLYSYLWDLDTGTWGEEGGFDGSFYALVPGGSAKHDSVIEIKFEGLSGRKWQMSANSTGVDGPDAGRSVEITGHEYHPEYPIYLNPPAASVYDAAEPSATGELTFAASENICGGLASGFEESSGTFSFEADLDQATYHIVCDLNGDGVFDLTSNEDLALTGPTSIGTNSVAWDGLDNAGNPIPEGSYECQVMVTVGEVHFVASDVETSYPGMRMYEMGGQDQRMALPMVWNDYLVQDLALGMPNGEVGMVSPGPDGLDPGSYADPADPNVNARAWGNFTEEGKGNYTLLDTFVWLRSTTSATMTIEILDGYTDANHDGKPDACWEAYLRGGCNSGGVAMLGWLGLVAAGGLSLGRRRRR
jgi:hypothetical protein